MSASILRIPNFVKARSPKKLRDLMLKVNTQKGMQHKWINMYYVEAEQMHYAWYMSLIEINLLTGEFE